MTARGGLRIAVIGQRGVPATFGGIEHHVEEIGARLGARGHAVSVFLRTNYVANPPREYRSMRLRTVPTVGRKRLDCIVHSALCTALTMTDPPDIVHYHALGPAVLAPIPRFFSRSKVAVTIHGLDHQREKWGGGARALLRTAGWLSARVPDATIAVSQALVDHYAEHYRRRADYIPNGVNAPIGRPACEIIGRFGLRPQGYLLFVGRLVPEKAPDLLIRAFRQLTDDLRLVVVGGSSFTDGYVRSLRELAGADSRVLLTGFLYGAVLEELYSNALAFVLPSTVEGLPLTLLEAASHGTPVVASAIPPHVEVLGGDGPGRRLFAPRDVASLAAALRTVVADAAAERSGAALLRDHVLRTYTWDDAVAATEGVYWRILAGNGRAALPLDRLATAPHSRQQGGAGGPVGDAR